ncbi:MAG: hypothetical protein ABH849_01830 [Nanoarchaeota archaeon]
MTEKEQSRLREKKKLEEKAEEEFGRCPHNPPRHNLSGCIEKFYGVCQEETEYIVIVDGKKCAKCPVWYNENDISITFQ